MNRITDNFISFKQHFDEEWTPAVNSGGRYQQQQQKPRRILKVCNKRNKNSLEINLLDLLLQEEDEEKTKKNKKRNKTVLN